MIQTADLIRRRFTESFSTRPISVITLSGLIRWLFTRLFVIFVKHFISGSRPGTILSIDSNKLFDRSEMDPCLSEFEDSGRGVEELRPI